MSAASRSHARQAALVGAALLVLVVVGAAVRFVGLDWDSGHHLHPDERFLTMVETSLMAPQDVLNYFDTDRSPLNPRNQGHAFFVYGTWPITLVHLTARWLGGLDPGGLPAAARPVVAWLAVGSDTLPSQFADYSTVHLVGRRVVALMDTLAILALFALAARLYGRWAGLIAAALGTFTAFHIQQAHFFTVDAPANLFVTLCLVGLAGVAKVGLADRGGRWGAAVRLLDPVLAGAAMGMALGSKISAWPLVPLAVVAAVAGYGPTRGRGRGADWWRAFAVVALIGVVAYGSLRVAQPDMWAGPGWLNVAEGCRSGAGDCTRYSEVTSGSPSWWFRIEDALPDAVEPYLLPDPRWAANMHQIQGQITGHGMDWPPNHQWWGRLAYWFPYKNMVLWGMGLPLGLAATAAWAFAGLRLMRGDRRHLVPWLWSTMVFAYLGVQWAKTMRYFLPIYPALTALTAWALVAWWRRARAEVREGGGIGAWLRHPTVAAGALAVVVGGTAVWGLMVTRIFTQDHSRVAASRWIYHNVPTWLSLRVAEGEVPYLPANHSLAVRFEGHEYQIDADGPLEAARVHVPTDDQVVVDGVHLSNLWDPVPDPEAESITVEIVTNPFPQTADVVARGTLEAELSATPTDLVVPLPATVLQPGDEYYARLDLSGAPVRGRLPIIALETPWDDAIPLGLDGYAPYDQPDTSWGEGLYGSTMLTLFAEDEPAKVDMIVDGLAGADYVVSTSNRVYGSVAQLPTRFPMTLHYYDLLFHEEIGFEHVAEITSYPGLGPLEVPDQAAEEAWHVYDHPKVDVFRRTEAFDPDALRAELMPLTGPEHVTWEWPAEEGGLGATLAGGLMGLLPTGAQEAPSAADAPRPLEDVMLSPERFEEQRAAGTWSRIFSTTALHNRSPAIATVLWYLLLAVLGLLAFPLVALGLGDLADRGWAVSRAAGLLIVSWLAWWVSSLGLVGHTPWLVWACVGALAVAGALALKAGANRDLGGWIRSHWRVLAAEEAVFLGLFALFLVVRLGNPDLWHPYYGGEKPMDLAYLNATLRTDAFPPYDPWFAGGTMNYYYFGFVLVGALIELTRVVPWIAYNLTIPSLAAMTGLGVFGVVYAWSRGLRRPRRLSMAAAGLGTMLAVVSGNLFQVQMIAGKLAELSQMQVPSALPGVSTAARAFDGWLQVVSGEAALQIPTGHWYWNASRAIPAQGAVQPITEFPFFTFLYADLHAHMMALPITVLALAAALSWTLTWSWRWTGFHVVKGAVRLFIAALAIGALWPANTWDYPTYGLVAAGALAVAHWGRRARVDLPWLLAVGLKGAALLALSLALFLPYHLTYVPPYGDFERWTGPQTPVTAYLTVHGLLLFAIATWAAWRVYAASEAAARRDRGRLRVAVAFVAFGLAAAWLVFNNQWLLLVGLALAAGGLVMLLRPGAGPEDRFAGWILALGVVVTLFVEYVVLAGDIGRMNTVFKFYIQVWILWATLAAVAVAWAAPHLRRVGWGTAWWATLAVLIASGLTYTVTATRGKWADRFPAMGGVATESLSEQRTPGLSGVAYQDYANYMDGADLLDLKVDRDGIEWMLENIEGTPVILEGHRLENYRWGGRYSIHTGLPTVLGWEWHQIQQRNAVGSGAVTERTADVKEIYDTTDLERAQVLLDKYRVDYVIVGEMERNIYAAEGLAKFDDLVDRGAAAVAYEHPGGDLTIYRIPRRDGDGGVPGLTDGQAQR